MPYQISVLFTKMNVKMFPPQTATRKVILLLTHKSQQRTCAPEHSSPVSPNQRDQQQQHSRDAQQAPVSWEQFAVMRASPVVVAAAGLFRRRGRGGRLARSERKPQRKRDPARSSLQASHSLATSTQQHGSMRATRPNLPNASTRFGCPPIRQAGQTAFNTSL